MAKKSMNPMGQQEGKSQQQGDSNNQQGSSKNQSVGQQEVDREHQLDEKLGETNQEKPPNDKDIELKIGHHELIIHHRYDFYYTLNDFIMAFAFLVGSIMFFWESTQEGAIWLFVVASIQLLIRPLIRIMHKIHLRQVNPNAQYLHMSKSYAPRNKGQ